MHGCDACEEEPNGSKAVSLLCRLLTLVLALTSGVAMAAASECTVVELNGATLTITYTQYPSFVFLVWFNILAAILEAAAIYLQLIKEEHDKLTRILVVVDVAVQAMLYSSTGATFAAAYAYSGQIGACSAFGKQVAMSKLLSLFASFSISVAAVAKDVPLPFSVWPKRSPRMYFF